jgi:hypothetical protein
MTLSILDSLRSAFDNLNDRERKLVIALGGVVGALLLFLPIFLSATAIAEVEDENADIRAVLRSIANNRTEIAEMQAQREAAERRYDNPAPPLGSFLEAKAQEAGYDRPLEVTDQPERVANGYTRRHVRADLPGVDLRTVVNMLTEIENSPYPVAVELVQIEHFQAGDRYNVEVGVIAFDRNTRGRSSDDDEDGDSSMMSGRRGTAGPPAP